MLYPARGRFEFPYLDSEAAIKLNVSASPRILSRTTFYDAVERDSAVRVHSQGSFHVLAIQNVE